MTIRRTKSIQDDLYQAGLDIFHAISVINTFANFFRMPTTLGWISIDFQVTRKYASLKEVFAGRGCRLPRSSARSLPRTDTYSHTMGRRHEISDIHQCQFLS